MAYNDEQLKALLKEAGFLQEVPKDAIDRIMPNGVNPLFAGAEQAPMPREKLLQLALSITSNDRNKAYGNPEDNFQNIADYWNTYLTQRAGGGTVEFRFTSQDVPHMMILMKMARLATNPGHYDSLVDIAGYAACGADCQERSS